MEKNVRVENGMQIENGMITYYLGKEKNIVIPDDVTEIAGIVFKSNANLETVVIGKNVAIIYAYAFKNCYNLKSVTIPESVQELPLSAFYGCDNLQDFHFEGSFRKINIDLDYQDDGWGNPIRNEDLERFLKCLNEESLLQLIEYCPKVCFAIPSERCTDEFIGKAENAIISGMCKRADIDKNYIDEDVKLLPRLKEWKKKEYDKHLTPIGRLMTAIGEFKDNSK